MIAFRPSIKSTINNTPITKSYAYVATGNQLTFAREYLLKCYDALDYYKFVLFLTSILVVFSVGGIDNIVIGIIV